MGKLGFGQLGCTPCPNPCSECREFDIPENPAKGVIISKAMWIYGYPFWDLTPYRNIMETYPEYRCGFWRIVRPVTDGITTGENAEVILSGCITSDGTLHNLPNAIISDICNKDVHTANYSTLSDIYLCLAAPKKNEYSPIFNDYYVTPFHWPSFRGVPPFICSINQYQCLRQINYARTRPQEYFSDIIKNLSPLEAWDSKVTQALRAFSYPRAADLNSYWPRAVSVPPLRLNRAMGMISSDWCYHMIRHDEQIHWEFDANDQPYHCNHYINDTRICYDIWSMTPRERLIDYGYQGDFWEARVIDSNNPGATQGLHQCIYAFGRAGTGVTPSVDYCSVDTEEANDLLIDFWVKGAVYSDISYAIAAFMLDWGVTSAVHRWILRNPEATELGCDFLYETNPNTQVGPIISAICTSPTPLEKFDQVDDED